jgi:predicted TIM-barrel fold metal-dependent hydrolase
MTTERALTATMVEPVADAIQDEDLGQYQEQLADHVVVDTDVHMDDTLGQLPDYLHGHHRKRLDAILVSDFKGEPGNSLRNMIAHVAHLGSTYDKPPRAKLASRRDLLERMAKGVVDYSILYPSELLPIGYLPDSDWAAALATAYNQFMVEQYGGIPGIKIALLVAPQLPDRAAAEIRRHGHHPDVVGVAPADIGVNPPIGNQQYWALYEAAAEFDLPVVFHGTESLLHQNYPLRVANFRTLMEVYTVGFPFTAMLQMMSVVCEGVPARFPNLRFAVLEAGVSWMPFVMYRTDTAYRRHRVEMPSLERQPSEYMREWYIGTHELETLPGRGDLTKLIELYRGQDTTMWSSDWPHQERDLLGGIMRYEMPDDLRRKILGENALRLFGLERP